MKVRYWMFLAVFTLVISTFAFAGNSCALATQADTNGAIKDFDFAAPSSSLYYQFKVSAGHSYSVAVREPYDDGGNNDLTVTVASENTTCNRHNPLQRALEYVLRFHYPVGIPEHYQPSDQC